MITARRIQEVDVALDVLGVYEDIRSALNRPAGGGGSGGAGSVSVWGDIGGLLSNQVDLQEVLDAKQTLIDFTPGSIFFAGADGGPAQDNSNFSWNDIDNKLIVGGTIQIFKSGGNAVINETAGELRLSATDNERILLGVTTTFDIELHAPQISWYGATIHTGAATTKGLIIKAAASQSANLLELNSSSGSSGDLAKIDASGNFYTAAASSTFFRSHNAYFGNYGGVPVVSANTSFSADGVFFRSNEVELTHDHQIIWVHLNHEGGTQDLFLGRAAAANLRLGAAAAASPVAQTLSVQNALGTNVAGANLTIAASAATGNAAGGDIDFKTSDAGASGTTLQTLTTKMTLNELGQLIVGKYTGSELADYTLDVRSPESSDVTLLRLGRNDYYGTIGLNGSGFMQFASAGSSHTISIGSSGIGIDGSASFPLEVVSDVGNTHARFGPGSSYSLSLGTQGNGYPWIGDTSGNAFILRTNAADRIFITSGGLVGVNVGITSPDGQFQVNAGAASTVVSIFKAAASQTGNLTEWRNSSGTILSAVNKDGRFQNINGSSHILIGTDITITNENNNRYINLMPNGGGVGIGTATPAAMLDVAGNIFPTTDNTYYLGKNDDDTPKAWKGVIVKDTTNGKYYRVEVISGVVTATDLTD